MAQVAEPEVLEGRCELVEVPADPGALPTAPSPHPSPDDTARSEPLIRGAGCVNRARPDLWGTRVGNHPGLPGLRQASLEAGDGHDMT